MSAGAASRSVVWFALVVETDASTPAPRLTKPEPVGQEAEDLTAKCALPLGIAALPAVWVVRAGDRYAGVDDGSARTLR